ncbi:hypothetical protein [Paenibacillus prosopidis]|uniref:Uncharacterized protein n=1 Tax=Paenibacillus prosopidis TaxID=630520 RepID=A0A368VUC0_9BACL|nr:hypothetical protein [Paenibacillus prosopidis]RCW44216.1 hypothetical protein DFP97_11280 [Paenibacillus prosopidis]
MPGQTPSFNGLRGDESIEELRDIVAQMMKTMNHMLRHLSSKNITEVGGWFVDNTELVSKDGDVGMSTDDTGSDPVRFFAGGVDKETAPWKVRQNGVMEAIGAIIGSASSGMRVVINSTGLHAYDENGVERITIGTTPAKGAKALIFRDSTGAEQTVMTHDTESVDGASRTGQYITAHGAYILLGNDGDVRIQASDGKGFRAVSGTPELNDGFGWKVIATQDEVDTKATAGASTSSNGAQSLNGGIPIGTSLATSSGGSVTWNGISFGAHSHTQN